MDDVAEGLGTGGALWSSDAAVPVRLPWSRYVALGDSFTEGIGDPEPASPGGHRGWADRVAEELSSGGNSFAYANLAVRGLLFREIMDRQVPAAMALHPDLVTISAGGNDVVVHGRNPDRLAEELDTAVGLFGATGATVVLFTGPDWGDTPILGRTRGKVAIYNENLRTIAVRHNAVIADMWAMRELTDPRMWDADRLHFSPLGHHTVAALVLDSLNIEHSLQPWHPMPLPPQSWRQARNGDLVWAREYLVPWVLQRLRHRSSATGINAKRPTPGPVFGPTLPPGQ
jgi:lysophospholipase L1-like esterase